MSAAQSSQEKDRRINLSIKRLVAQLAPPPATYTEEEAHDRADWFASQIKSVLQEYVCCRVPFPAP
jgi:hypothetical protein